MSAMNKDVPANSTVRSPATLVARLRDEAQVNECFKSVMLVFSMRERARQQVTIDSLMARMQGEGFNFTKKDYQGVIRQLAQLGFGTIQYDKYNEVSALKNIRITLQSIGRSVTQADGKLESWKPAVDFKPLQADKPTPVNKAPIKKASSVPIKAYPAVEKYGASISVTVNGKALVFDLPHGITPKELTNLLAGVGRNAEA